MQYCIYKNVISSQIIPKFYNKNCFTTDEKFHYILFFFLKKSLQFNANYLFWNILYRYTIAPMTSNVIITYK